MSIGIQGGKSAQPRRFDPELTAIAVANTVPIVGVALFDWSVLSVLTLYWFELGIACIWAVVRALFAERPITHDEDLLLFGAISQKRVTIPVPVLNVDIRLLTIPALLLGVPLLIAVWILAGALLVGPVETVTPDSGLSPWLLGGLCGIFVTEGWQTVRTYFAESRYREHNAVTALRSVVTESATVLIASAAVLVTLAVTSTDGSGASARTVERTATGPLVAIVIAIRLSTDVAGYYTGNRFDVSPWSIVGRGGASSPPTTTSIDVNLDERVDVLRAPLRGRMVPTVAHVRRHPAPWLVTPLAGLAGAITASRGDVVTGIWILVVGIGGPLGLVSTDYWIRYAGIEYRTDGESVVSVDTFFGTPLWQLDSWDAQTVEIECDPLDKRLDTATVLVTHHGRPIQLPRLHDPSPLLDALVVTPATGSDTQSTASSGDDSPETMSDVALALLRLEPAVGSRYSLMTVGILAVVTLIALVILTRFEGRMGAALAVFFGTTVPFVGLVMYILQQ